MKIVQQLLILFAFFGIAGCDQQILRPFNPTGNPDTTIPPQAVPTLPPIAPLGSPSIYITPLQVEPDESITISGDGFTPNGSVTLILKMQGQPLSTYELKADAYGNVVSGSITLPGGDYPAELKAYILDETSGQSAEKTFSVVPSQSGEKAIQFEQAVVIRGQSVGFTARGFYPNEEVRVKITRPDGTEVEYSAQTDDYGQLQGTVSVDLDRPLGLYETNISGASHGHEANGWFTVMSDIVLEDDIELPVCTPMPIYLGDMDPIEAPIHEITSCTVPVTLATCSFVPGPGNAGTLSIHCLQKGTGTGSITFIPEWTGEGPGNKAERTATFTLVCK